MNKKYLTIAGIILAIVVVAGGLWLYSQESKSPIVGKCGDGICDTKEKTNPKLCPQDCKSTGSETEQTCSGSWLDASDSRRCCSVACETSTVSDSEDSTLDYDNSPFGFHPGNANNYAYAQDIGDVWSREGMYVVWNWVDINRDGGFKFTEAIAEAVEDKPSLIINYDGQWLNVPEHIGIVANVCPFRKGGAFANSIEPETYQEFVEKMVERYDGDDNLGCVLAAPDCYNAGDNQYPSAEVISVFENNPIKFWQMCNQVTDTCQGIDCKENYASSFALAMEKTYKGVKNADSSASVLIAGDSAKEFYPTVFEELNGNYIDIIDFHRFGTENAYDPKDDFDYLKENLQSSGFDLTELKFWITETGTYSGDPISITRGDTVIDRPYQSEKNQASGLIKRYVSALSYKIEKIFWAWNIVEGFKRDCTQFDYTGLVYDGCDCNEDGQYVCEKGIGYDLGQGVKKLAYYTYKLMVEKLEGSDWDNIQTIQKSDNIYIYKFTKNDEPVWVVWWDYFDDTGSSKTITIDVSDIGSVTVTEAVPKYETGQEVTNYSTAFNTETKTASGGEVEITLGESPVFVEGN